MIKRIQRDNAFVTVTTRRARLIAAAPKLLEACKEILKYHEKGVKRNDPVLSNHYIRIITNVITKAEGGIKK